jgi:hypothetical protein
MSVVIVNEAFVRRYVDDREPIGARFGWGTPSNVTYQFEIIGVAKDAVYADPREEIKPLVYFPFSWGDTFVVRAAGAPGTVAATLRRQVQAACLGGRRGKEAETANIKARQTPAWRSSRKRRT